VTGLLAAAVLLAAAPHPQLAPPGAHLDRAWRVGPRQVLVEWHRVEHVAPKGGRGWDGPLWRLVLWTKTDGWHPRNVIAGPNVLDPIEDVRLADVTRDGYPDVLASDVQGNHGVGPYHLVEGGLRPRTLLAGRWFETRWLVRLGVLTVVTPYGRLFSMCCPEFIAHVTYRWSGTRLVVARTRLIRQHY
jgi:hypothetical protein